MLLILNGVGNFAVILESEIQIYRISVNEKVWGVKEWSLCESFGRRLPYRTVPVFARS